MNINVANSKNQRAISSSRGFPAAAGPIFNALTSEPIVPTLTYSGFTGEGNQFYNPFLEVTAQDGRQFLTDISAVPR